MARAPKHLHIYGCITLCVCVTGCLSADAQRLQDYQRPIAAIAIHPNGKSIFTNGLVWQGWRVQGETVKWDLDSGKRICTIGHNEVFATMQTAQDNKHIVGFQSRTTYRGNLPPTTMQLWSKWHADNTDEGFVNPVPITSDYGVHASAVSGDGTLLAIGSDKGAVRIWRHTSREVAHKFHAGKQKILALAFSPDGKWLACAGEDHKIYLANVTTGNVERTWVGHKQPLTVVQFAPNGKWLVSGSGDDLTKPGELFVWDVQTGQRRYNFAGHAGPIAAVAFTPNSKSLASGSRDGQVKFWDVTSGIETGALRFVMLNLAQLVFSPDGRRIAIAGGESGLRTTASVRVWDVTTMREILFGS